MEIKKCLFTNNDCYKKAQKITPKGIVVHSTGANNPYLKRYVQPDDGLLGDNQYNNDWNRSGLAKCVHAFVGKDKNGVVRCYQTLPFDYACWGVGSGSKGSYNYNPAYIQFEICEDNLTDKDYFTKAFDVAAEFCAYLVKEYNLNVNNVVSHYEAYKKGYGSNHGDCDHWLKKFGKTMDDFRNDVRKRVTGTPASKPENNSSFFGSKGYFSLGDTHENIGRIAEFMYRVFPAYTNKKALGNYYGPYIKASITEFQRRAKKEGKYNDNIDGACGPKTLKALEHYGFKK